MNLIERIWQSTLGKKYIMAVTGAVLLLYAVGHLVGTCRSLARRTDQHLRPLLEVQGRPALGGAARPAGLRRAAHRCRDTLAAMNKAARPVSYAGRDAYGHPRRRSICS